MHEKQHDQIVLFTDFGWHGPYIGQMKSVIYQHVPEVKIIDLMHDVPAYNIKAAAYLLSSLVNTFSKSTIFVAVIDPGVGSERRPCIVEADGYWFVGPDNGLFNVIQNKANNKRKWEITWRPERLSTSFHGRDIFAPIAAEIASGDIHVSDKVATIEIDKNKWTDDISEIIYIDHYGNCMTGLREAAVDKSKLLYCNNYEFRFAETFSAVKPGSAFFYINSSGLCELSVNQGSAAQELALSIGEKIKFEA